MDLDTTRNKDGYSRIIDEFSQHKADILIGTQMVTKGLDFGEVELVGVLNADSLINFPDFRSAERPFNMLEQVAGRAGRRDGKGQVVIQTYNPGHPILGYAARHDYEAFYRHELEERRAFNFPPFSRIINTNARPSCPGPASGIRQPRVRPPGAASRPYPVTIYTQNHAQGRDWHIDEAGKADTARPIRQPGLEPTDAVAHGLLRRRPDIELTTVK